MKIFKRSEIEPIAEGNSGKAWEIDAKPKKRDQNATIKAWLLNLPGSHPLWSNYEVGVISLRDIPGVPPANKKYPEAEYELIMIALNPDYQPSPTDIESLVPLRPENYVSQFHGLTEDEAAKVGLWMVLDLVKGQLIAEPSGVIGARELWANRLNKAIFLLQQARTIDGH